MADPRKIAGALSKLVLPSLDSFGLTSTQKRVADVFAKTGRVRETARQTGTSPMYVSQISKYPETQRYLLSLENKSFDHIEGSRLTSDLDSRIMEGQEVSSNVQKILDELLLNGGKIRAAARKTGFSPMYVSQVAKKHGPE